MSLTVKPYSSEVPVGGSFGTVTRESYDWLKAHPGAGYREAANIVGSVANAWPYFLGAVQAGLVEDSYAGWSAVSVDFANANIRPPDYQAFMAAYIPHWVIGTDDLGGDFGTFDPARAPAPLHPPQYDLMQENGRTIGENMGLSTVIQPQAVTTPQREVTLGNWSPLAGETVESVIARNPDIPSSELLAHYAGNLNNPDVPRTLPATTAVTPAVAPTGVVTADPVEPSHTDDTAPKGQAKVAASLTAGNVPTPVAPMLPEWLLLAGFAGVVLFLLARGK